MDSANQLKTLLELDARHDELLERLDDLDKRVAKVLAECQPPRASESGNDEPTANSPQPSPP